VNNDNTIDFEEFKRVFWGVYTSDIASDMEEHYGLKPDTTEVCAYVFVCE